MRPIYIAIISILCMHCQKEAAETAATTSITGNWIEISPCDSCSMLEFTKDHRLLIFDLIIGNTRNAKVEIISKDEMKISRLWDMDDDKKVNISKYRFYSPDTLFIEAYRAVDYGVYDYTSVLLKKNDK